MSDTNDAGKERTCILGPTISFKGELWAEEDLIIQGSIEGSISHERRVTIGSGSTVRANVDALLVVIEGAMEGDIRAEQSVEVKEGSCVTGNIKAPAVTIRQGANFNGNVDMGAGKGVETAALTEAAMKPTRESRWTKSDRTGSTVPRRQAYP